MFWFFDGRYIIVDDLLLYTYSPVEQLLSLVLWIVGGLLLYNKIFCLYSFRKYHWANEIAEVGTGAFNR